MADITNLTDLEGNVIYPITKTNAVYDEQGNKLNDILDEKANKSEIPDTSSLKSWENEYGKWTALDSLKDGAFTRLQINKDGAMQLIRFDGEKWITDGVNFFLPGGENLLEVHNRLTDYARNDGVNQIWDPNASVNDISRPSIYNVEPATPDIPVAIWGFIQTFVHTWNGPHHKTQIYTTMTIPEPIAYIRTQSEGIWYPWKKLTVDEDLKQTPVTKGEVTMNTINEKLNWLIENGGGSSAEVEIKTYINTSIARNTLASGLKLDFIPLAAMVYIPNVEGTVAGGIDVCLTNNIQWHASGYSPSESRRFTLTEDTVKYTLSANNSNNITMRVYVVGYVLK